MSSLRDYQKAQHQNLRSELIFSNDCGAVPIDSIASYRTKSLTYLIRPARLILSDPVQRSTTRTSSDK